MRLPILRRVYRAIPEANRRRFPQRTAEELILTAILILREGGASPRNIAETLYRYADKYSTAQVKTDGKRSQG